uniref:C-C motif chemokine n=1 Tax=Electrophorus electricus TaxID=8005 RepID=A0A4W4EUS5_ELEEL
CQVEMLLLSLLNISLSANGHVMCCFDFHDSKIPVNFITKYEPTSSECPKAGVVFTTKKPARICANPHLNWVKEAMKIINDPDICKFHLR